MSSSGKQDPDEDSHNSAIYVQGLNDNVTLDDLAYFFKGTRKPIIHIYLDKENPKAMLQCLTKTHQLPRLPWNGLMGNIFKGETSNEQYAVWYASPEGKGMLLPCYGGPGGPMGHMGGCRGDREGSRVPKGTHLGEETSSTELGLAVSQSGVWKPELHLENRMKEV
ncbi:hypothetical protein GH733_000025 [Mirounga leonina]|nr:hypothetical protein GH733_000025 [Mirounga leonina]